MDKTDKELYNALLSKLERLEEKQTTGIQKLAEGMDQYFKQREHKDKAAFSKHTDKAVEDLTPLEKGGLRQKTIQEQQDIARKNLAAEMEKLANQKEKRRNWHNKPID